MRNVRGRRSLPLVLARGVALLGLVSALGAGTVLISAGLGPSAGATTTATPMAAASQIVMWRSAGDLETVTNAQLAQLQQEGVGGVVGSVGWLAGMGGTQNFTGNPAVSLSASTYSLERTLQSSNVVARAAAYGIRLYLGFNAANYYNTATPFANWFDDASWQNVVLPDVAGLAGAAHMLGFAGLAMDQELYGQTGGAYSATWSWDYPGNTSSEAQTRAEVRLRGQQLMSAILSAYPGVDLSVYDALFPDTWDSYAKGVSDGQQDVYESNLDINFWDGMTSVEGYGGIWFWDETFYKDTGYSGGTAQTWNSALTYEYNSLFALFSRSFSDWSYAADHVYLSPSAWIDGDGTGTFTAARSPSYVGVQLQAFHNWGMGGEFADFAYAPIGSFDYSPYASDMQAAATPGVVNDPAPSLTVGTSQTSGGNATISGTAHDTYAIRDVSWSGPDGSSGTAQVTWQVTSGNYSSGYGSSSDWSISGIPLQLGPNEITVTAENIHGVTTSTSLVLTGSEPLMITASNGSMTYGSAPPAVTPLYSGFDSGDTPSSLTTQPTCTTAASSSSTVSGSPYPTSCSGASDANYSIGYAGGAMTITPAVLTITAQSTSTSYGSVPTISPLYSGFVNGDSAASLTTPPTCTTNATTSSPVSGSPYTSSCSGAVDPNYTIVYVNGSVTVSTAPLTITAQSPTMTYGSRVPGITPRYTGLENGDSASSLTEPPTCSTAATSSSPPAPPPTYLSSCSGASDPNYAITYVNGTTTVTPAPIAVAVAGSQANQGSPSFTGTDTPPAGVTVDTSGVTCGTVNSSRAISAALPSGSYTLVAGSCSGTDLSGPNASDYGVTYTSGSGDFTVTGGPLPPTPPPPPPGPATPAPPTDGYWLVGSDGGIFTFGSAQFHGSTGGLTLQRPVVGISPTANKGGYWLVASDGGVFAFGDAGYFGSIPGEGLSPAGSGLPNSLSAPIVGMVPSSDGGGYFMVAADGGVFAFGDARFEGSCPGIGGCSGSAVSVVPDASGNGYWLMTQSGNVYAFGDAPSYGAPGNQGSPVTSAVRTVDGHGYWVLLADGAVYAYGDAVAHGGPVGSVGGFNPASAIFTGAGGGYWVASATGAVFSYGDAPNDGSLAGTHLNGSIIAAAGF